MRRRRLGFLGDAGSRSAAARRRLYFSRIAADGSGARNGCRAARAISGSGHVTAAQAELPDELVRSRAGDAHAAAMNSVQVVSGTEADLRRAGVDAQLFPGVVADVGVAQVHRPASDGQGVQALAEGDIEGVVPVVTFRSSASMACAIQR